MKLRYVTTLLSVSTEAPHWGRAGAQIDRVLDPLGSLPALTS